VNKFFPKNRSFIYPENYHLNTEQAWRMRIVAGSCYLSLEESKKKIHYKDKRSLKVPAQSGLTINESEGICQNVCPSLS